METVKYWKKIKSKVATKLINDWKVDEKVAKNMCGIK